MYLAINSFRPAIKIVVYYDDSSVSGYSDVVGLSLQIRIRQSLPWQPIHSFLCLETNMNVTKVDQNTEFELVAEVSLYFWKRL